MENIEKYITPETPDTEYALDANQYLKYTILEDEQKLSNVLIEDQYQNFNNLGINFLEGKQFSDDNFANVVDFVNDNYLLINNVDLIMSNAKSLQVMGRYIYELICIDLVNEILPKLLKREQLLPETLLTIDAIELKQLLMSIILEKIEALREIIQEVRNIEVKTLLLKWSYFLDLFDNDLEMFKENVLSPIIIKYQTKLFANS
jgi:hypothetical protein